MQRRRLTKIFLAAAIALLTIAGIAQPAAAEDRRVNDPAGDVPYARGDIILARVTHTSSHVDLRVRTRQGGQPVATWPNRASFIRWRIDSDFTSPGPEYYVDLRLARGADTVFVGRIRYVSNNQLVPNCRADQYAPSADYAITAQQNLYRFRFLRGCVGAPNELKARATMVWDNGAAGRGPVYTDYAPNRNPTQPVSFF